MIGIELTRDQITYIDDIDSDVLSFNWYAIRGRTGFYAARGMRTKSNQKIETLHRVIFSKVLGRPLSSEEIVDHINGNTLDNRRSNLRLATKQQNQFNRSKPQNNTSGYKGVTWNKNAEKWKAQIGHAGTTLYLGYFDTPEEAALAYEEKAKELFGEFYRDE